VPLVFDKRGQLAGRPGVHALVAGVSAYPHLPGGAGPAAPQPLGLQQLTSTALSAFRVHEWLLERRDKLLAPLATVRLLLAPSADELAAEPALGQLAPFDVSLDAFRREAAAWRDDAASDRGSVTFFYFAGHGVQRTKDDAALLLEDFGDGLGDVLDKCINMYNVYNGMAPSPSFPSIARTQLYFVDACRVRPAEFSQYESLETSRVWPVELSGRDDRRAPTTYATVPGALAYGLPAQQSFFSRALIDCLNGDAAEAIEENGAERWCVSVNSLHAELADAMRTQAAGNVDDDPDFRSDGRGEDFVVHYLDGVPTVRLELLVDPDAALPCTSVTILNDVNEEVLSLAPPLTPNPYECPLPAGVYTIRADVTPPRPPYVSVPGRARGILPPGARRTFRMTP
jgi:hypothetical protein